MARSRDISKVLSSNTTLATDAEVAATYQTKASAGLTLLSTTTFSAIASHSVNDVFSTTYNNYRIIYEITNCTVDGSLAIRMRTGGSDASGAGTYLFSGVNYNTSGTVNAYFSSGSTRVDLTDLDGGGSSANVAVYAGVIDLHNPNLSEYTVGNAILAGTDTGGSYRSHYTNFWHVVESPYTGFTLFHAGTTPTITGAVSVYGYNK